MLDNLIKEEKKERKYSNDNVIYLAEEIKNSYLSNGKFGGGKKKEEPNPFVNGKSHLVKGIKHNGKRYSTYTNLPTDRSALYTFTSWQKKAVIFLILAIISGLIISPIFALSVILGLLTFVYFLDFLFSTTLLIGSLKRPSEISVSKKELNRLDEDKLPTYSVLCPLYKEALVLSQFLSNIQRIDWPKDKLDVLLILEEDDRETIDKAYEIGLPSFVRMLIVPNSQPKTKPKACNYALAFAKGSYAVIYDAEDRPDKYQLKKAYIAFNKVEPDIVCLQSKLNYYNTDYNILTRLFTAEYSLWFDLILPGLQRIGTTIPLGGTSNHFRINALNYLDAWDPFNVTEDCDLGARLFKEGYKTAIINSTTYEEANSKVTSWLKQRSRWIKGYLQTYLVHMRNPLQFIEEHGKHAFLFQVIIGMRMVFMIINPFLWLLTTVYFLFRSQVGYVIEALYPSPVYYFAVLTMIFGNFAYFYNYMIGLAKREKWEEIKYVFLIPIYWIMASVAAGIAFYQLLVKPHYWEKTQHGLDKEPKVGFIKSFIQGFSIKIDLDFPRIKRSKFTFLGDVELNFTSSARKNIYDYFANIYQNRTARNGILLIGATVGANFVNFLYSAYLGRVVELAEFGTLALYGNLFTITSLLTGALAATVSHKTAHNLGVYKKVSNEFYKFVRNRTLVFSSIMALLWLTSLGFLKNYFNTEGIFPFLVFTPIWIVGFLLSVNSGFINGSLNFDKLALVIFLTPAIKFMSTVGFVTINRPEMIYTAYPISLLVGLLVSSLLIARIKTTQTDSDKVQQIPYQFLSTSFLMKFALTAFLTLDVVLAKHYLSPQEAGEYALLSVSGKIIFFLGGLFTQFINPVISRMEGENKNSNTNFNLLILATFFAGFSGYLLLGLLSRVTIPLLFGDKALSIISYLPEYGLGMLAFTVASAIITYNQARKKYTLTYVSVVVAIVNIALISIYHSSIHAIVSVSVISGMIYLMTSIILHFSHQYVVDIKNNLYDFYLLFAGKSSGTKKISRGLNILIFNWRDTKHVWAGGAEVYTQEIAERWVKAGNCVTLFCGNDGKSVRNEEVNEVNVVRRGGFYMVYVWAFLYYLFKFRGRFDVVVDCENGIPFFTPLFVRVPKVLLVHHVHQEIFRKYLSFPFYIIAEFIETKLMPFFYKDTTVVTVSESSKNELQRYRFLKNKDIRVVNPGINLANFMTSDKTVHPSVLYLGRLKPWKSIDVLIKAMKNLVDQFPDIKLTIAGFGESRASLEKLVKELRLEGYVEFLGKVSEERKAELLANSWVFAYPSTKEGWGISIIEASASGTPVVASNVSGLRDSVRNPRTGYLVPQGSSEEFADKIGQIITNKDLRERLGKGGIEWSRNFSWDKSSAEFLDVIYAVTKEKVKFQQILFAANPNYE